MVQSTVDIYINGQRLKQGEFAISDPNNPVADSATESLVTSDMLDQFDFYAQDFSVSNPQDNGGDYTSDPTSFINSNEDYFNFLNQAYDINANGCSDPNDLTCSTTAIDCTTTPDDPSCQQPPSSAVCASDSTLSADDPNCSSPTPQACQYDSSLSADDPNCVPPEATEVPTSKACQYDSSLSADDPNCVAPTTQACQYDSSLSADDPNCVAPTTQACQYDPSLSADDPNCVAPAATEAPTP